MAFIKHSITSKWKPDAVFSIVAKYNDYVSKYGKENAINATIGSLCDEEGKLVTFNCVFENEKRIPAEKKASYANLKGDPSYIKAMQDFILDGNTALYHDAVATPGGTGAVFLGFDLMLDAGESIILPEVAWGSYRLMADEFNFDVVSYDIYDLDDMLSKVEMVGRKQGKVLLVINSPCQNPCGLSYTDEQWERIANKLNDVSEYAEVILLNDIAYIDYAFDPKKARKYFRIFDKLTANVLLLVAASTSKSFSYYGQRLGALIILSQDEKIVEEVEKACELKGRCTWSNGNHGAMVNVAEILNDHLDEYLKEKDEYLKMLKARAELFLLEAKEVGLEHYPYDEGFFITLKMEDNRMRDEIHQRLLDQAIFSIKCQKGIRLAICSLSMASIAGLAKKIKEVYCYGK